jgi:heme oxygenase (mycobilin-producing)
MTVIKINAITVPAGAGDELAHRFAARAGAVDDAEGFEGFELLRPTDDRDQWLVLTRWRDEDAFQAWVESPSFAEGHRPVERHRSPSPRTARCGRTRSPEAPNRADVPVGASVHADVMEAYSAAAAIGAVGRLPS